MIVVAEDGTFLVVANAYKYKVPLIRVEIADISIWVDRQSVTPNDFMMNMGVACMGSFGIEEPCNIRSLCIVLQNLLLSHFYIFGIKVNAVSDVNFGVFANPRESGVLDMMESSDFLVQTDIFASVFSDYKKEFYRRTLTPTEFYRMYPSTGCPNMHALNDTASDVESTCSLCKEYRFDDDMFSNSVRYF